MHVVIDCRVIPPRIELTGPDVFDDFGVSIRIPDHVWVDRDLIERLACVSDDSVWRQEFEALVAYASKYGWVDEQGRIRGHVIADRFGTEEPGHS